MTAPKTVTVKMEIVNEDGSKTIVTTAELDATRISPRGDTKNSAERIIIGMIDPTYDESNWYDRRDRWVGDSRFPVRPYESHFNLDLQLMPVKPGETVFTITKIEPPLTRLVAYYNKKSKKVQITSYTEGGEGGSNIQETAAIFKDSIYFFLDIPE